MDAARAFTVGDDRYFLGVVALLNSLRLTGHDLPLTVLDLGFLPRQLDQLATACDIVRAEDPEVLAHLAKADAPARSRAETVVLLDSDVIVTGSLQPAIDAAAAGQVFVFVDVPEVDRWFAEWAEIFGLDEPLRRQPYVNSGFVAFSRGSHPALLDRWRACCALLRGRRVLADTVPDDPVWLPDQDALNALLMSEVPAPSVALGPERAMVLGPESLQATRVADLDALRCEHDGEPATLLHAVGRVKPWQPEARWEFRPSAYTRCLRRALSGPDLAVRIPERDLPPWLRSGRSAVVHAGWMHAYEAPARRTRPVRRRLGLSPVRWVGRGS